MQSLRAPKSSSCSHRRARPGPRTRVVSYVVDVKPQQQQAPVQAQPHEDADAFEGNASKCPVLRALQPVPENKYSLFKSLYTTIVERKPTAEMAENLEGRPLSHVRFLGVVPAIAVGDASVAREMTTHEPTGKVAIGWPKSTAMLLGEKSVVVQNGEKHKYLRKLMAPALSLEAVESYLPDIQAICTQTLDDWVDRSGKGEQVLASPEVKTLTLKIIISVALGRQLTRRELTALSDDFTVWLRELFTATPYDTWPFPMHESMNARRRLVAYLQDQINVIRAGLAAGDPSVRPNSTLAALLAARDEEGRGLTDEEIVDNVLTLLFAGHDTTSAQLTRLIAVLQDHPQVLTRVREEQCDVVSRHGHTMTPAALKEMTYTQAVLAECLRLYPVVGGVMRSVKEDVAVSGYQVPKDSMVIVSLPNILKRDPRWPSSLPLSDPLHPSHFNPDRFMSEEGRSQGWQVPFGVGVRTCAGIALAQAEAKVFLATLARGYTIQADTNTAWKMVPIPRPVNDLPVTVQRL